MGAATPKTPAVPGLVAHFDLCGASPGKDLAGHFETLKAEGEITFDVFGARFGLDGALSSSVYSGPDVFERTWVVWFRRNPAFQRNDPGALLVLEQTIAPQRIEALGTRTDRGFEMFDLLRPAVSVMPNGGMSNGISTASGHDHFGNVAPVVITQQASGTFRVWGPGGDQEYSGPAPARFVAGQTKLWIGPVGHAMATGHLEGFTIAEARLYDRVLSRAEIDRVRQSFVARRTQRAEVYIRALPRHLRLLTRYSYESRAGDGSYTQTERMGGVDNYLKVVPAGAGTMYLEGLMPTLRPSHWKMVQGDGLVWLVDDRAAQPPVKWAVLTSASGAVRLVDVDSGRFLVNDFNSPNEANFFWATVAPDNFFATENSAGLFVGWAPNTACKLAYDFQQRRNAARPLPIGIGEDNPPELRSPFDKQPMVPEITASGATLGGLGFSLEVRDAVTVLAWVSIPHGGDAHLELEESGRMAHVVQWRHSNPGGHLFQKTYGHEDRILSTEPPQAGLTLMVLSESKGVFSTRVNELRGDLAARTHEGTYSSDERTIWLKAMVPGIPSIVHAIEVFRGRLRPQEIRWRNAGVHDRQLRRLEANVDRIPATCHLLSKATGKYLRLYPDIGFVSEQGEGTRLTKNTMGPGWVVLSGYYALATDPSTGRPKANYVWMPEKFRVHLFPDGRIALQDPRGFFVADPAAWAGGVIRSEDPLFPPYLPEAFRWTLVPEVLA